MARSWKAFWVPARLHRSRVLAVLSATFTVALLLWNVPPVSAETWTVTKTADTFDGVCDGDCSLREAVVAANASAGDDTIYLPAGTYELVLDWWGAADEYGALEITQEDQTTAILGAGAGVTVVDAEPLRTTGVNNPDRVFAISYHAGLELVGVTVTGGYTENFSSSHQDGGGIWNWNGDLTITDSIIEGNVAGVNGGGVANHFGTATITNTIIRANNTDPPDYVTAGMGGGVYNSGTMMITDSTIEWNASDRGGGIANEYGPLEDYVPTLTIEASTISNNEAAYGAGIANFEGMSDVPGREALVTITTSKVIDNHADRVQGFVGAVNEGGGIANSGYSAATVVVDSTLSSNQVAGTHAVHPGDGSGGAIHNRGGRVEVSGTTVSGNEAVCDQFLPGDPSLCGRGGGIANVGSGRLALQNSTISGNQTALLNSPHSPYLGGGGGGGIAHMPHCEGSSCFCPETTISNTTITHNEADHGGGVDTQWESWGGGLYDIPEWEVADKVYQCAGLTVDNSVIAGNTAIVTPGTEDCWGDHGSGGHNLVGMGTGCVADGAGDIASFDPLLGSLADNGGPGLTHALLPGSAAIDSGDSALIADQRGASRPQGFATDIGAFEAGPLGMVRWVRIVVDYDDSSLTGWSLHYLVITDDDNRLQNVASEWGIVPAGTVDGVSFDAQAWAGGHVFDVTTTAGAVSGVEAVSATVNSRTYYVLEAGLDPRDIVSVDGFTAGTSVVSSEPYGSLGFVVGSDLGTGDPDLIATGNGSQVVAGLGGNDWMDGGRAGDHMNGNGGADFIVGGLGNDKLFGRGDGDILIDGEGVDKLTGNLGPDVFVLQPGDERKDRIVDFEDGVDLIHLPGLTFADLTITTRRPGRVLIKYGSEKELVTDPVGLAVLVAEDFTEADFISD